MKIVTVIGARPQFIKAAAVSRIIREEYSSEVEEIILHTGQHYDVNMSDVFFDEMEIPKPHYRFNINGVNHGAMTGQMMEKIEEVLLSEKPDCVLVYGDTNSTLAGALAAKKLHVKLAHVEAGLRSFNMKMPEEINRIVADRISDFLFCPTKKAISNLHIEGFDKFDCNVLHSGDVMLDAALFYSQISSEKSKIINELSLEEYVLATFHRAENTDNENSLANIVNGLNHINTEIPVIVPVHPRTRKKISDFNLKVNFKLINPLGYFDMIELIKNSKLVLTDSGGLQKEAFFFKKISVTMREETEWVELVENGFNILSGSNSEKIYNSYLKAINMNPDFSLNLYGKGNASSLIVNELLKRLS
ncbi:MAG: non-hydrolyzing UDP-N-acetylglucosamine 2-epimerase [Bacteroidota bacterium]